MVDYERDYEEGDIVEIVTPQEYRERGGDCADKCAIAQYCGSVCEVSGFFFDGAERKMMLCPIAITEHFKRNNPIDNYLWGFMSVKRAGNTTAAEAISDEEFDDIFA